MLKTFFASVLVAGAVALPGAAQAQMASFEVIEATSAILGAGRVAGEVAHLRNVPSVGVIDITMGPRTRFGMSRESDSLEMYAAQNARGVAALRHALMSNPVTRRAVYENHVRIDRVVGVSVGATGSLRFFVD